MKISQEKFWAEMEFCKIGPRPDADKATTASVAAITLKGLALMKRARLESKVAKG
jgi:hypothetical protein